MLMNIFDFIGPMISCRSQPRPIRYIKNGKTAGARTTRDLQNLPERVLRDIGYTRF